MADPHLNLFYSYNRDNDLIENNLTRAFIITLRHLHPTYRDRLLKPLLRDSDQDLDFGTAQFALQGHLDPRIASGARRKVILTLASSAPLNALAVTDDSYQSIPDAWVFAPDGSYCILIEAKIGQNAVAEAQVAAHASAWFRLRPDDLAGVIVHSTWEQLCDAIDSVVQHAVELEGSALMLLTNLADYLELYGYRAFRGLELPGEPYLPKGFPWESTKRRTRVRHGLLDVSMLPQPPLIRLRHLE